ncbi:MAG: hypothetical protein ACE5HL_05325 [Terriglobia bacterium]
MRRAAYIPKALLGVLLLGSVAATDDLAKLRQKLARETDPADRAKITVKIGREMLKQIAKIYKEGAYTDAEQLLGEYREAVRAAHRDLAQSGRDARRKPKGFKDLEIHLRKSERKLEDVTRGLPYDVRAPVEEAVAEMEAIRLKLLRALMTGKEQQP